MKKYLLGLLLVFISTAYASSPERIERLAAKAILEDTKGYFVLSDGSSWKTMGFSTRWRSFSEWWNDVKLVPDNYECVPDDWFLGTEVEVYSKYLNLQVSEADASNEGDLRQCTHLFYNSSTGQVLFAIALDPAEFLVSLYTDARNEGYNAGYDNGYNNGYLDGYGGLTTCPTCGTIH